MIEDLWVGALSKKDLEDLRKSEYSSSTKDWWIITEHGVKEDYDAAESYKISIQGSDDCSN
ncbi:MAG: hypothetical protein K6E97_10315 [Treponema sp.]|nr:hypothetical protein [Treponema sp.]